MVHFILLAAGNSRRFGSNKLQYPFQGKPLYRHTLDKLVRTAANYGEGCHIYVVTQTTAMLEELERYRDALVIRSNDGCASSAGAPDRGTAPVYVHPVFSPESSGGISYSIRNGLECAMETEVAFGGGRLPSLRQTYFFFFAADQPFLKEETISDFVQAALTSEKPLGCVAHEGIGGNPTFFNASFCSRLRRLTGDTGGRKLLRENSKKCFLYEIADEKELADADTPDFFEQKRQQR